MARLLIGIILLWGGFAIWINRNTESLPYRDYQNLQILLSASYPPPDPTTSLKAQIDQVTVIDFTIITDEIVNLILNQIIYFVNLNRITYVSYWSVLRQPRLQHLDKLQYLDLCSESVRSVQSGDARLLWEYNAIPDPRLDQFLPNLRGVTYCSVLQRFD